MLFLMRILPNVSTAPGKYVENGVDLWLPARALPNMNPGYLATLVLVGSNRKVYMPPPARHLAAVPTQVHQAG